jgi:hypothetical protein
LPGHKKIRRKGPKFFANISTISITFRSFNINSISNPSNGGEKKSAPLSLTGENHEILETHERTDFEQKITKGTKRDHGWEILLRLTARHLHPGKSRFPGIPNR